MINWAEKSIEYIIGGTTSDGTRYLELFLSDYAKITNETSLNASCNNCIKDYHKKWIAKMAQSNSQYKLKPKYSGIPLNPFSQIRVTNANITDELGLELATTKGYHLFEKYPTIETATTTAEEPKPRKRRTSKK